MHGAGRPCRAPSAMRRPRATCEAPDDVRGVGRRARTPSDMPRRTTCAAPGGIRGRRTTYAGPKRHTRARRDIRRPERHTRAPGGIRGCRAGCSGGGRIRGGPGTEIPGLRARTAPRGVHRAGGSRGPCGWCCLAGGASEAEQLRPSGHPGRPASGQVRGFPQPAAGKIYASCVSPASTVSSTFRAVASIAVSDLRTWLRSVVYQKSGRDALR